jgi:hypothetical protein
VQQLPRFDAQAHSPKHMTFAAPDVDFIDAKTQGGAVHAVASLS